MQRVPQGKLAASGRPSFDEDWAWLHQQGIGEIVSLIERSPEREKSVPHRVNGLVYLHNPVRVETAPLGADQRKHCVRK